MLIARDLFKQKHVGKNLDCRLRNISKQIKLKPSLLPSLCLGAVGGSLEYVENSIKSIKGQASQLNKNPDNFQIIILASLRRSSNHENRFPFSGSIDEIGSDIQRLKNMGVDNIIFGYNCPNRKRRR